MDKKKQIEEMAKVISNIPPIEVPFGSRLQGRRIYISTKIAEHLYNENYRKQSENTIELPCKVGDVVYAVSNYYGAKWQVYACRVDNFTVYEKNIFMSISNCEGYNFGANICEIGKTVFLNREEAENALAKMKGGAE